MAKSKTAKPGIGGQQLPMFLPATDWTRPASIVDLRGREPVVIDLETKDNGLANERPPGWPTCDGYIAGIGFSRGDWSAYYSLRHPDSENWDIGNVLGMTEELLASDTPIVMQNSPYDLGWLFAEGVETAPKNLDDTLAMNFMLDENHLQYDLDSICERLGIPGKDTRLLAEVGAAYGYFKGKDVKSNMWRFPAKYVGMYGEQDCRATGHARDLMMPMLERDGLIEAYRLEMDLVPMCRAMRKRGMRVNERAADASAAKFDQMRDEKLGQMQHKLGTSLIDMKSLGSATQLAKFFDQEQVPYPRTKKTNAPSFKKDWMKDAEHWLPKLVVEINALDAMANKFIRNYILDYTVLGRIHAEIHQFRGEDEGGTRSYRFAYSGPPLQQIPARDALLAPLIRAIFLPEAGELWGAHDYSQQEPRLAVHFAKVCKSVGADDAVNYYALSNDADFHNMVAELTGLPRSQAKIINLGLMYGMGVDKLAASLGVSREEALEILDQYHGKMPFIKSLVDFCTKRAENRGYIKLIDGARCHWDLWEPTYRPKGEEFIASAPLAKAHELWPGRRLRRAFTHKAMNRLVQGSAARQTKLAMRECWRAGMLPLLQMHDELDFSHGSGLAAMHVNQIMCDVVRLHVPMKVDCQFGYDWGQASEEIKGVEMPSFEEMMRNPGNSNRQIIAMRSAA